MASQPEGRIVKKIIDWIKGMEDWDSHARKVHGSRYSSGEPDIDACINGRSVKIEVKVPGKVPTPQQMARLRKWESAGALCGWATSVEEAASLTSHLENLNWSNPQLAIASEDD